MINDYMNSPFAVEMISIILFPAFLQSMRFYVSVAVETFLTLYSADAMGTLSTWFIFTSSSIFGLSFYFGAREAILNPYYL